MILIYGAGKYGKILLEIFTDLGIDIYAFVETEPFIETVQGKPVISLESLSDVKEQKKICIAVKDKSMQNEIQNSIKEMTNHTIRFYNFAPLIEDYLQHNWMENHQTKDDTYYCNVCQSRIGIFVLGGIDAEVFHKFRVIGGGLREYCTCPVCGTFDRERWLFYVMTKILNISSVEGNVLHIAPEKSIENIIRDNIGIDYYTGDIEHGRAMHVVDLTNIQFRDDFFDLVICNHVFEHITDDNKAIGEVYRVLKNDGLLVFSFPLLLDHKTIEDSTSLSNEERLSKYGQKDHVRLYGTDYKIRFEKLGFTLAEYRPKDFLDQEDILRYGMISEDLIVVAKKNTRDD